MPKTFLLNKSDALLITDVQNDFLSGGALAVPQGEQIIPVLNEYERKFQEAGANVLASRDWHPTNHKSFKAQGGSWSPHCVQETDGAKFHKNLKLPKNVCIISKATLADHEAYSAFDGTDLKDILQKLGVKRFFIGGLATDYCIVNTVLDAIKNGFETVVLMDAIRGIDVNPGDTDQAIAAMVKAGAQQATVANFPEVEETLPLDEDSVDELEEKPAARAADKKKARLRPKDARRKVATGG
ncbi:MAG: isochorismatase family protein [Candidatus Bathyarchaeia archaeon]